MVGGGDPFYLKFWVKLTRVEQNRWFSVQLKLHFAWRKSATKFLCVKTASNEVVTHSLAYLSVRKRLAGDVPSTWKFGRYWPTPLQTPIFNLFHS